MESNNSKSSNKQQNKDPKKTYQQVLREIKLIGRRSAILRSHRDTDNLDFDGRN